MRDDQNRFIAELGGNIQQFIQIHGSDRLKQYESARIQSNINRTDEPSLSPDSYAIVNSQDDLIIAEVQPGLNGCPHFLTRFRLILSGGQWQLDDYFWKCQCSNGECAWCGGTGVCAVCHGQGECKFCDNSRVCQLCKGARTCARCEDSEIPGWRSMTGPFKP